MVVLGDDDLALGDLRGGDERPDVDGSDRVPVEKRARMPRCAS
jgi:hypothetical protein